MINTRFPYLSNYIQIFSTNDRDKISNLLSKMEFGLLLRDDLPVNNVSSPIKLAEYLSCDVNVIISDSIKSYAQLVSDSFAGYVLCNNFKINSFPLYKSGNSLNLFKQKFSQEYIQNKYMNLFNKFNKQ